MSIGNSAAAGSVHDEVTRSIDISTLRRGEIEKGTRIFIEEAANQSCGRACFPGVPVYPEKICEGTWKIVCHDSEFCDLQD